MKAGKSNTTSLTAKGRFGPFGGRYVPETLMAPLTELEQAYEKIVRTAAFKTEYQNFLRDFVGRPTPLYFAERFTRELGGAKIWLKREDLNHTGAHKINNTVGQILLARKMGKKRIIAETGAGQHGLATATVAARFGCDCVIYMGELDMVRQRPNVEKMRLLGATVVPVSSGTKTLKDATTEAMRDWVTNVASTFYIIGSAVGPHPYPSMVRDFQAVIGRETKQQCRRQFGRQPDMIVACVGGGSNAIGIFSAFVKDKKTALVGVEAAGLGLETGQHSATLSKGEQGVLHGSMSYLLMDQDGQVRLPHSISAGLDYPGVGPEHAWLKESGRVQYDALTDAEALAALRRVSRLEGIIPALESAHALAWVIREAPRMPRSKRIVVCLSGRGDKDMPIVLDTTT